MRIQFSARCRCNSSLQPCLLHTDLGQGQSQAARNLAKSVCGENASVCVYEGAEESGALMLPTNNDGTIGFKR